MKVVELNDHRPDSDLPHEIEQVINLTKQAFAKHGLPLMLVTEDVDGALYPIFPDSASQAYGMVRMLNTIMDSAHDEY